MLFSLFWLSCYIFRTTTGTTYTTKKVVLVVLVVVLYFKDDNGNNLYNQESCPRCFGCRAIFWGRQLEQLIQQSMLSPLCWLSCYILRTTTGTTYTTKKVVLVVLVVVLYFKDDNLYNLYNKVCCPRCVGCRAISLGQKLERPIQEEQPPLWCKLASVQFTLSNIFILIHPPPNGAPPIDINVRACCRGPCAPSSWLWRAPARGRAGGGHPGPRPRAG